MPSDALPVRRTPPIRRLTGEAIAGCAESLGALLVDAVADGASVGFMAGLAQDEAARYWRDVASRDDGRVVLVVESVDGIDGAVSIVPLPGAFQRHRAEIAKLVVHRRARGRGLAAALMTAAEAEARAMERPVVTLMTRRGSAGDRLYRRLGWTLVGVIADDSLAPDGAIVDAALFRKRLADQEAAASVDATPPGS
jgi:GNAT superfamily N-acetyltransferase